MNSVLLTLWIFFAQPSKKKTKQTTEKRTETKRNETNCTVNCETVLLDDRVRKISKYGTSTKSNSPIHCRQQSHNTHKIADWTAINYRLLVCIFYHIFFSFVPFRSYLLFNLLSDFSVCVYCWKCAKLHTNCDSKIELSCICGRSMSRQADEQYMHSTKQSVLVRNCYEFWKLWIKCVMMIGWCDVRLLIDRREFCETEWEK